MKISVPQHHEAYYGLPRDVVRCQRCLMTNQKPHSINETTHRPDTPKTGMSIDAEGVCDACRFAEHKNEVDWSKREKMLMEMLDRYRRDDGPYDVIVSGSGGKDSMKISHLLKYKYGMHPLTVTWSPHLYADIGWRNMQNWIHNGGFDNLLFTPNGKTMRILTREAFDNLYFPFQPFKFGIKFWATKMAIRFNIPLVMYGEPYAEYGSTDNDEGMTPSLGLEYFVNDATDIYLGGLHADEIKKKHGLTDNDLLPFMPLRSWEVEKHEVRVEYLGWYLNWDPQESFYYAAENCGFEPDPQRTEGTYGKYASLDDKMDGLHYFTHLIKFGIGRATFDTSQEIRNGHITRQEAVALVGKYELEFPKQFFGEMLEYMNMDEDYFWDRTDRARSPHLWAKKGNEWALRHPATEVPQAAPPS